MTRIVPFRVNDKHVLPVLVVDAPAITQAVLGAYGITIRPVMILLDHTGKQVQMRGPYEGMAAALEDMGFREQALRALSY